MSFWKIVAGAAAGVGTIVALPVFGAIGTITLAGAAVGTVVGGIGGALASAKDESDRDAAKDQGKNEAAAAHKADLERLVAKMKRMQEAGAGQKEFERRVATLFAVGFAVAAADGPVNDEERAVIADFVGGASAQWPTEELRKTVERFATSPPDFGGCMKLVDEIDDPDLDSVIDEMIELAITIDGGESSQESAFRAAWQAHRDARHARTA